MLTTLLNILHVSVCLFLIFVVLLQQGKGGGMGGGVGSGAAQQVFGGRGAGNILTRATAICAGLFMVTSVSLAYLSSSGDRALQKRAAQEEQHGKGNEGAPRAPESKGDKAEGAAAPAGGATTPETPATPAPADKEPAKEPTK